MPSYEEARHMPSLDISLKGYSGEGWYDAWLPAFVLLGQRTKDWIFENNGQCRNCKEKFSKDEPHCKCAKITGIEISRKGESNYNKREFFDFYREFQDLFQYEKRRDNSRYCAVIYKKKKDKAEGRHTKKDIEAIYELQEGCCYYCLTKITYNKPKRNFDVDHIKPLAQGGTNWPDNMAAACRKCNQSKGKLGGLAFWNKIEKKYGSNLILRAKKFAKEQRPKRKKISEYRKLETQKKIRKKLYLKDSYPQIEAVADQYKKLQNFKKECPFCSVYLILLKGICTDFSNTVFNCTYEEIKKDNQPVFYLFSVIVADTLYGFLKSAYGEEKYFLKTFNLESLISEFYLIAPFNDVQKIKAKQTRLNRAIRQKGKDTKLSECVLNFLNNPIEENKNSIFTEARNLLD